MSKLGFKHLKLWVTLIALLLMCAASAPHLGRILGISYKGAYLVALASVSAMMSCVIWLLRRRLKRNIESLPESERQALAVDSTEVRFAISDGRSVSPQVVTLVGTVAINGMVIPLFVGPLASLQYVLDVRDPVFSAISLVAGFVIAWLWWSVGVSIWRSWALRTGMTSDEVQWRGEDATLLWPKGHFFERTEFRNLFSRIKEE